MINLRNITIFIAITCITTYAIGQSQKRQIEPKSYISNFDMSRYLGLWYEIARFENRFERNLDCVTALYLTKPSGGIMVLNRGYNTALKEWSNAEGRAKMSDTEGLLRVSFFLFFYSDYHILALGESDNDAPYSWALVGSRSPKYLWILARDKELEPEVLETILARASQLGYDTNMLHYNSRESCSND